MVSHADPRPPGPASRVPTQARGHVQTQPRPRPDSARGHPLPAALAGRPPRGGRRGLRARVCPPRGGRPSLQALATARPRPLVRPRGEAAPAQAPGRRPRRAGVAVQPSLAQSSREGLSSAAPTAPRSAQCARLPHAARTPREQRPVCVAASQPEGSQPSKGSSAGHAGRLSLGRAAPPCGPPCSVGWGAWPPSPQNTLGPGSGAEALPRALRTAGRRPRWGGSLHPGREARGCGPAQTQELFACCG